MIAAARAIAFTAGFYAITAVVSAAALPLLAGPGAWLRWPMRFWAKAVLAWLRVACGIRVRVTGRAHLPTGGAALIAARHESAFDTVIWLALLPSPVYVLKRELLAIPGYGWHARHAGMIAVDRAAGASALRHLVRAATAALAQGRQVVVFPEGTRMAPGKTVPPQPGIAALAAACGLPIIPVATDSGRHWGRGSFAKRPGTITVAVQAPLPIGLSRAELIRCLAQAIGQGQTPLGPVDVSVDGADPAFSAADLHTRQGC